MRKLVCLAILLALAAPVVAQTDSSAEATKKVLLVGESWVSAATHYKDAATLAEISRGLGTAMPGIETSKLAESELMQTRGW